MAPPRTSLQLTRAHCHLPQAPQRERVSNAAIPGATTAAAERAASGRTRSRRTKHWKELLRPDINMGVPQLMSMLEPKVVWEHVKVSLGWHHQLRNAPVNNEWQRRPHNGNGVRQRTPPAFFSHRHLSLWWARTWRPL